MITQTANTLNGTTTHLANGDTQVRFTGHHAPSNAAQFADTIRITRGTYNAVTYRPNHDLTLVTVHPQN